MKKRTLCDLFLFIPLSKLLGFSKQYKSDYLKKFSSYLQYSLGDFEVVDIKTIQWRADPLPARGTGLRWVVAFTDDSGFNRKLTWTLVVKSN